MERETQRRGTLGNDTAQEPSGQELEFWLLAFDKLKPHIIWVIIVGVAVYEYFHSADVVGFLILIAAAAGSIPLSHAIALLQGRSLHTRLLPPSEEKKLGEHLTDDRDELE